MYESCMLALGDVHDVVSTGKTGFDVLGFLSSVVLKQLTSDGMSLLTDFFNSPRI